MCTKAKHGAGTEVVFDVWHEARVPKLFKKSGQAESELYEVQAVNGNRFVMFQIACDVSVKKGTGKEKQRQ